MLRPELTVLEQALHFNERNLEDHELKTILNRFIFPVESWPKLCGDLSGGERMRLLLCCMQIGQNLPDMIILDEPTNNLDIPTLDILTLSMKDYRGTLIVISHDQYFLKEVGVKRKLRINLKMC